MTRAQSLDLGYGVWLISQADFAGSRNGARGRFQERLIHCTRGRCLWLHLPAWPGSQLPFAWVPSWPLTAGSN